MFFSPEVEFRQETHGYALVSNRLIKTAAANSVAASLYVHILGAQKISNSRASGT